MIQPAIMVIIESEGSIGFAKGWAVSDAPALIDRMEATFRVAYDPDPARAWTVENQMIHFAAVVIVESECQVVARLQIVSTDPAIGTFRLACRIEYLNDSGHASLNDPWDSRKREESWDQHT